MEFSPESSDTFVEVQLWQVFTGAKERWKDGYYQELLAGDAKIVEPLAGPVKVAPRLEKWASQIEKVIPILYDFISRHNMAFGHAFWNAPVCSRNRFFNPKFVLRTNNLFTQQLYSVQLS